MIETVALAGTVVGYLVKSLKENKDFKKFTSDFTTATINEIIRPIFLVDDEKPSKILSDLQENPDDMLNQESAKIEIAKLINKKPENLQLLKEMVSFINSNAESISSGNIINQQHFGQGDNIGGNKYTK